MNTNIGAEAAKLAGLQIDLLQKIRNGHLTLEDLNKLNSSRREVRGQKVLQQEFTIRLGTTKTVGDLRRNLELGGINIGPYASDIFGKVVVAPKEIEINLIVRSVDDLGFEVATRQQIYDRANEFGWDRCPTEVGPQLRLQYGCQPKGEVLIIASEPITASGDGLRLFSVERRGSDLWLSDGYAYPGCVWGAGRRFVFARRK